MTAALEVRGLRIALGSGRDAVPLVEDVGFAVAAGRILALVGESGSGKSLTGLALMGLLSAPVRLMGGEARLLGTTLPTGDARAMRRLRGRQIAMIFQDPMMTLNPVLRIGAQMTEAIRVHDPRVSGADAAARARDALAAVGIPAPEERLRAYPHQLSGGMRQRVVIATALLNHPAVIIADEPTTALDVTTQGQILFQVKQLASARGTALVWITHDLAVVASLAHGIAVMYAGRIVETGPAEAVLRTPLHPYTRGLLDSVPGVAARQAGCAPFPACRRWPAPCGQAAASARAATAARRRAGRNRRWPPWLRTGRCAASTRCPHDGADGIARAGAALHEAAGRGGAAAEPVRCQPPHPHRACRLGHRADGLAGRGAGDRR
jgi:peptide/nickel transport system ATP-binding protein